MKPFGAEYWDNVARTALAGGFILDNQHKRELILAHLMRESWIGQRVLEIGVGTGVTAAALTVTSLNYRRYVGTDCSAEFCRCAQENFNLSVVHTDVRSLPRIDGGFTRVIALDSLEHVPPEHRAQGYAEIGAAMAPNAKMLVNMPLGHSYHSDDFDFPFGLDDILALMRTAGLELRLYEEYGTLIKNKPWRAAWVVLER